MNKTTAVLQKKTQLTDSVYELVFKTENPISYTPGQYLFLQINETQKRMYSILKYENNLLTLVVDTRPGGVASQLFKVVEPAFTTQILYAFGDLVLQQNSRPKLFIASGTGVVPMTAMLNELTRSHSNIKAQLLWGIHDDRDNFLSRYVQNNPNITITTCVTHPSADYNGYVGRVTAAINELQFEFPLSDYDIYLCGNPEMIKDMEKILKTMDISNYSVERY